MDKIQPPAWYDGLKAVIFSDETSEAIDTHFVEGGKGYLDFRIQMISGDHNKEFISLKDLPNVHPDYIGLIAAARFIEKPSKTTLAEALRTIAKGKTVEEDPRVKCSLPWVIEGCLDLAMNQDELLEIAERAEAGAFGDADDWIAAEARWRKDGVTIADVDYMANKRGLFDKDIARYGSPPAVTNYIIWHKPNLGSLAQKLLDVYRRHKQASVRSDIAGWFILATRVWVGILHKGKHSVPKLISSTELAEIAQDAKRLDMACFAIVRWSDSTSEAYIDVLDTLGRALPRIYISDVPAEEGLSNLLVEAFCNDPSRIGLLRFLVHVDCPSIPAALLAPERYEEPMFREAAILIRLKQGDCERAELVSLVKSMAEIIAERSGVADDALNIARNLDDPDFLLNVLLTLFEGLPPSAWKTMQEVIANLNDMLRRRTSRLDDSRVWSELRLPEGLKTLFYR